MDQNLLPFDISFETLEPEERFLAGFEYSYAGVRIYLKRNDFKLMVGSFYGPTAMFSMLSLISFSINPDIVRFNLNQTIYFLKKKHGNVDTESIWLE